MLRPLQEPPVNARIRLVSRIFLLFSLILLPATLLRAQQREGPGKPIGKVSVDGNLILMELDQGALGQENLFDLDRSTLRFSPGKSGYRVEKLALEWDADFGRRLAQPNVTLHNFAFPFSGKAWDSFTVGVTGSIRFGPPQANGFMFGENPNLRPRDEGGVSIARFDQLADAAGDLVNTVPAICVFFKPRMSGDRYVKELADRVVVTWDVTEPYGNIQDFTWYKTINRFQAVLHKDGTIDMSYDQLAAKDAIIGVYPLISGGAEKTLATLPSGNTSSGASSAAANLNIRNLRVSVVDGLFLKITFQTAGPVLPEGDSGLAGISYRVHLQAQNPSLAAAAPQSTADWAIFGFAPRNPAYGKPRYVAFGPGVSRRVDLASNTISMQGLLPPELRSAAQITVSAESFARESRQPAAQVPAHIVALRGLSNPEVHFSALKPHAGPYPVAYEAFHYYALPNPRDLSCTVIKGLGDNYDFLVYYSNFRVDNQEAGTPSDGPLGSTGPAVTGIGAEQRGLASYCSPGRFQWEFIQPVYAGSIQAQEYPPADAPIGDSHDITFYAKQLEEISQNGKIPPYMYAMSQIGHEMGHRWAAFVNAKVGNETIPLGPVHWDMGLEVRVPFPYVRPTEASIMGGGVWQDNFDGTFTQLDDNYYVPATGYSYLDLYLMGLISPAEVPDFFILRHLEPVGKDANGHPIFRAERTKVTIQDVIAAEGPRLPDVNHSQRQFNTGMVIVVQHGLKPSRELIERTEGIREQWIKYFSIVTGRRASMTANPR
jgi:hypothetical protein